MDRPVIRPSTDADMAGIRTIAHSHHALDDWPSEPDYLDLERTTGRLHVAQSGGAIVGYGGVLYRGELTHLADLFVAHGQQSAGLGSALLRTLLVDEAATVTYASADPRALALYVRHGMRPRSPVLYLSGSSARLPAPATPATPGSPVCPATIDEVVDLDAELCAGRRPATLDWYAAQPGVTVHATPGGYAFIRTVGETHLVGPAGGRTPADSRDTVLAALAAIPSRRQVNVAVFGPHPLLPALLAAGFHITDVDTYLDRRPDTIAVDRYIPHTDLG